jgi:hypothetical protein
MSLVHAAPRKNILGILLMAVLLLSESCSLPDSNETHNSGSLNNASPASSLPQSETPKKAWEIVHLEAINRRSGEAGIGKLSEVEVPSASMEIRIWAGFDTTPLRGLILRRIGDQWSAIYVPPSIGSLKSRKQPIVMSPPKSGWDSLWEKLNRQDILTLPDAIDVGADNVYPDALGVVVETRSKGSYRAYNYNGFNTSERVEAKKIGEICKVVSEEFKIFLC